MTGSIPAVESPGQEGGHPGCMGRCWKAPSLFYIMS